MAKAQKLTEKMSDKNNVAQGHMKEKKRRMACEFNTLSQSLRDGRCLFTILSCISFHSSKVLSCCSFWKKRWKNLSRFRENLLE